MAELEDFTRLTEAAHFYINESFNYAHMLMEYKLSEVIFSQKINEIDVTAEEQEISKKYQIPEEILSLLQSDIEDPLTNETLTKLSDAWELSQNIAKGGTYNFDITQKCEGVEMLGLVTNITFAIEVMTYRHLLFLNETGGVDRFTYDKLEQANPSVAMIYIFKGCDNKLRTKFEKIKYLYTLRNKAVHYTPNNARTLKLQLSELIVIWESVATIFTEYEKAEKFVEDKMSDTILNSINIFKERWL